MRYILLLRIVASVFDEICCKNIILYNPPCVSICRYKGTQGWCCIMQATQQVGITRRSVVEGRRARNVTMHPTRRSNNSAKVARSADDDDDEYVHSRAQFLYYIILHSGLGKSLTLRCRAETLGLNYKTLCVPNCIKKIFARASKRRERFIINTHTIKTDHAPLRETLRWNRYTAFLYKFQHDALNDYWHIDTQFVQQKSYIDINARFINNIIPFTSVL